MGRKLNFDWEGSGALKDFSNHITSGGSYSDFLTFLRDKYGVCVTVARLSQIKKKYLIDHTAVALTQPEGN